MRPTLFALALLLGPASALSQVHITIDRPNVSIGVSVPSYPTLQRIPNYPVYYAPALKTNYFFYDGMYWVFEGGDWQASSWYNGPWHRVDRFDVPLPLLRVPVRYYRDAPSQFRSYRVDAPPRWQEQWGASWAERHSGWDRWEPRSLPAPAPLPLYQRDFSGSRYPTAEYQAVIQTERYRYQPREQIVRRVYEEQRVEADKRKQAGWTPPGHVRDERGMPAHARGKAKGHDRERGDDDDDDKHDKEKHKEKKDKHKD